MKPRFLADADFNQKIVAGLRRREPSVDFSGAHDGGVAGLPDPEVIGVAADAGRILVSHDRKTIPGHFARFRQMRSSAGIIIVSQDLLVGNPVSLSWEAGVAAVVLSSAATLCSTARSDHPEHHSGQDRKVFGIRPEWRSASDRNAVRDHRNRVRDQIGLLFGIARIPQRLSGSRN